MTEGLSWSAEQKRQETTSQDAGLGATREGADKEEKKNPDWSQLYGGNIQIHRGSTVCPFVRHWRSRECDNCLAKGRGCEQRGD